MSMILQYGDYKFPTTQTGVVITPTPLYSYLGTVWASELKWGIAGYLRADGDPKSLDAKIQALENAFSRDGKELQWLHSDGSPTAHNVPSSRTWGGWRLTQPIQYPEKNGVEYVTLRTFTLEMSTLVIRGGAPDLGMLISLQETVDYDVLSPIKGHIETLDTLSQFQTLRRFPTYTAVQSGSAVGAFAMPTVPAPIWPNKLIQPGKITPGTPRYVGNSAVEFPVSWSYQYQSNTPFA